MGQVMDSINIELPMIVFVWEMLLFEVQLQPLLQGIYGII